MHFLPLTSERWGDFERLFGTNGACAGCWCMWWRLERSRFRRQQGEGNRLAMKGLVDSGVVPGILGYEGGRPVAWCSVGPRSELEALERSPVLKRIDDREVWSIVCFFIARSHRGAGALEGLIRAALEHVRDRGGDLVEAYPRLPGKTKLRPAEAYMGFPHVFERLGFEEVARPSKSRCVLRRRI